MSRSSLLCESYLVLGRMSHANRELIFVFNYPWLRDLVSGDTLPGGRRMGGVLGNTAAAWVTCPLYMVSHA